MSIDADASPAGLARDGAGRTPLPRFAWQPVTLIALGAVALLAATITRYGYHRDELYFRVLSRHLAWGYVDQPPGTPLIIRLSTELFGDNLWALRLPGLLFSAATVVVIALLARELGGGRGAQVLAALAACCAFVLISGHIVLTATVDIPASALVLLFVIRALLRDEPRWWLLVGTITGVSLSNKLLLPMLFAGILVGLLIAGPRRVLLSRYLWAGVLIALVLGLPDLIYQVTHDFPQLTMARALADHKGGDNRVLFLPMQLLLLGPPMAVVWIAGWVALFRRPEWRPLRALAWAYPLVALNMFVTGSAFYYPFALQLPLLAAGCVVTARWAAGRRSRWTWLVVAVVVSDVVGAFVALPLVPLDQVGGTPIGAINQTARDSIGWPTYVRQLADAYAAVPEADRPHTVMLADNYGEYGALDRYGPAYHLPKVYGGQNQLFEYGPPPADTTVVVAVGFDNPAGLRAVFGSCVEAGELDNGVGVDNEEQGRKIFVCRDPVEPWSALWERFHHYD